MPCPICGANCRCKKRGPEGICCSCHRHKGRLNIRPEYYIKANLTQMEIEAVARHERDRDKVFNAILREWRDRLWLAEYGVRPYEFLKNAQ